MEEKKGRMFVVCSWCGAAMGDKPCREVNAGMVSHGMCDLCAEKFVASLKDDERRVP